MKSSGKNLSSLKSFLLALTLVLLQANAALPAESNANLDLNEFFHDQGELFFQPSEPSSRSPVSLIFRCRKNNVAKVSVKITESAHPDEITSIELSKLTQQATDSSAYEHWQVTLPASGARRHYRFKIDADDHTSAWYNAKGASIEEQADADFLLIPDFKTPDWMKNGIVYQIFPDRFFDGNPRNNVKTAEYKYGSDIPVAKKWGESPKTPKGQSPAMTFYGGDLEGIIAKLGYIRGTLGANIIYLNPIFESPSNHKYDTTDSFKVDRHFGTNETLVRLSSELHKEQNGKQGYLLLDGVFNHTGDSNIWFRKFTYASQGKHGSLPAPGAYQSKKSPYFSYYTFSHWPDKYATFLNVPSLPKLNFASQGVKDVLYAKPDSIALHYLKPPFKIDGWRIDAPMYADVHGKQGSDAENHKIWREFRTAIKSDSSDALILGENWENVAVWTAGGDQWDCATNFYGFTNPVSKWISGLDFDDKSKPISTSQFDQQLRDGRIYYPTNVQQCMSNHLGNHDISRFAERCKGVQNKIKLAFIFQMTYVGAPTLYYGDEYGMRGGRDPDDRRTFDWERVKSNDAGIAFVHKLIGIRNKYSALRTGSFINLHISDADKTYGYGRFDQANKIAVLLNNDSSKHNIELDVRKLELPDGTKCRDELSDRTYEIKQGKIAISLAEQAGAILVFD
jgi:alpha-glucosidase